MTQSRGVSALTSEFDAFLFAPIYVEKSGLVLTVVSALARLDLDPWDESAELAGLTQTMAADRLTSFILALPDRPMAHEDTGAIVASLIARLPPQLTPNAPSAQIMPFIAMPAAIPTLLIFCLAIVLTLLMGSLALAGNQLSTAHNSNPSVPPSNTRSPQIHPATGDRNR
jgi:hypothetical protein